MRAKTELKAKARELYQEGKSYKQISEIIGIPKSSLSLWCRDLAEEKRETIRKSRPLPPAAKLPKIKLKGMPPYEGYYISHIPRKGTDALVKLTDVETGEAHHITLIRYNMSVHLGRMLDPTERVVRKNGPSSELDNLEITNFYYGLTDDAVIEMRKTVTDNDRTDIRVFAEKYKASLQVIRDAIKGRSFKHLNEMYPPPTKRLQRESVQSSKKTKREEAIAHALLLRRSDPVRWTYDALAKLLSEKLGADYRVQNVIVEFQRRDPDIRKADPPRPPRPLHERECVICEVTFQTVLAHAEVCKAKACQDTMKEYNLYR